jgi:hypothetical protein
MAVKKFTMFAAQAMGLAEIFQGVFAGGLEGPILFKVELSAPDGPSTGGGKLALQHIKLLPPDGGTTIVIGSANPVEKQVELRTHGYLANQHAQRFKGATLPIDVEKYKDLIKRLQFFFTDQGMAVVMVDLPKVAEEPAAPPPAQSTSPVVWVVLGAGVVIASALGAYLALR